jgi:FixJ family two-component response regulator
MKESTSAGTMNDKEIVAVVDDDESIRKALVRMLAAAGMEVLAFSSAKEFLSVVGSEHVSCVVSDLRMPDIDGLHLQSALAERMPDVAIVFVTGHGDVPSTAQAMKSGAVDFLEKPVRRADLLEAIARATERTHRAEAEAMDLNSLKSRYAKLTPRERQVFALVAAGLLNKQIAAELRNAEKTTKQHRGAVMVKMQAGSLADLVLMAEHLGVRPSRGDFAEAQGLVRGIRADLFRPRYRTLVG